VRNIQETLKAGNMVNVGIAGHWLKKQVVCEVQKWLSDAEWKFIGDKNTSFYFQSV
jgi:hypothetical protein